MKWNHIMDSQPENERNIVEVHSFGENDFLIGIRRYNSYCSFETLLKYCLDNDIQNPNFWWMYAEDFPFPKHNIKL